MPAGKGDELSKTSGIKKMTRDILLSNCGNEVLNCGNEVLNCGNEVLNCDNEVFNCDIEVFNCRLEVLNCGLKELNNHCAVKSKIRKTIRQRITALDFT